MKKTKITFIILSLIWASLVVMDAFATVPVVVRQTHPFARRDTALFNKELKVIAKNLNYPNQTMRFYQLAGYERIWVKPDTVHSEVYHGRMLLDCVSQFGLNPKDFHPDRLTYDSLSALTMANTKKGETEKAAFDIFMTDALITFINHIHYGKFNPKITTSILENKNKLKFDAVTHLFHALGKRNFMDTVASAQPKMNTYQLLQNYLHLVKGQYIEDCYEFPEGEARKMAINLERMRWISTDDDYYLLVNIPAYNLSVVRGDSTQRFKVVVGKPSTPSPELESEINLMTTSPEWKVPQKIFISELLPKALKDSEFLSNNHYGIYDKAGHLINANKVQLREISAHSGSYTLRQSSGCDNAMGKIVFRFPNLFDVYLHDSPEKSFFEKNNRAFSHGCLRIAQAEQLATLLLIYDGQESRIDQLKNAMNNLKQRSFKLQHPVPIKIAYFTCEITDGLLKSYPDVYHRDQPLQMLMFPPAPRVAKTN